MSLPRTLAVTLALALGGTALPAAPAAAAGHLGDRTLRSGMRGHDVRVLQKFLTRAGFRTAVDGVFGPGTATRVRRFQRSEDLPATGVVTRADARALRRAARRAGTTSEGGGAEPVDAPASGTFGARTLREGMHGHDVRVLQDFLSKAGFDATVDGAFGPATTRAVRRFERSQNLRVDGIVDQGDAQALRRAADQGAAFTPRTATPTGKAQLTSDGLAVAPPDAPPEVQAIIDAGNRIATKPYKYGGGHGRWEDTGYDCSGSMSYALHGAGLLTQALDSSGFARWGDPGAGKWVTIYANGGHSYMMVAGLRFDTSGREGSHASRWHSDRRSARGYTVRHPSGL
jgi:peptidoglycan hydrolase-like protein with peptidoglycan-binding domain